jgi:hypothetical protein
MNDWILTKAETKRGKGKGCNEKSGDPGETRRHYCLSPKISSSRKEARKKEPNRHIMPQNESITWVQLLEFPSKRHVF